MQEAEVEDQPRHAERATVLAAVKDAARR